MPPRSTFNRWRKPCFPSIALPSPSSALASHAIRHTARGLVTLAFAPRKSSTDEKKRFKTNTFKFRLVALQKNLSSSLQPPKMRLLPAKALEATAAPTSLYDRLGADPIKLVTSMLFDK
jgi:hypothetical protein